MHAPSLNNLFYGFLYFSKIDRQAITYQPLRLVKTHSIILATTLLFSKERRGEEATSISYSSSASDNRSGLFAVSRFVEFAFLGRDAVFVASVALPSFCPTSPCIPQRHFIHKTSPLSRTSHLLVAYTYVKCTQLRMFVWT